MLEDTQLILEHFNTGGYRKRGSYVEARIAAYDLPGGEGSVLGLESPLGGLS